MPDKQTFRCDVTGKEVNSTRIPIGWKRIAGQLLSPGGVKQLYRVAAVTIAVRYSDDEQSNKDLNDKLHIAFVASTALANWIATELYVRDVKRTADMDKLPPFSVPGLYQDVSMRFPQLNSDIKCAMENRIRGFYKATRFELLWLGRRSLATYRFPHPFPVRKKSWKFTRDDQGNLVVNANLLGTRVDLPLSTSYKYKRQRQGIESILEIDGKFGDLVVTRSRDGKLFARIAGYFPRSHTKGQTGTLFVRSDSDSLLVALNVKDQKLWTYHGDHVRRWVNEHRRKLHRWSDDTKYEDRPRPGFSDRRTATVDKFRHRMGTLTHQCASRIVNYAARRRFEKISLEFSDHRFVDRFPWHELEAKIKDKAGLVGIQVEENAQ